MLNGIERQFCRKIAICFAVTILVVTVLFATGCWSLRFVPLPAGLDDPPAPSLLLTDREGRTLRELPVAGHYARAAVPIGQIPRALRQATVAAEDRRFYSHGGVDPLAVMRALGSQLGWRHAGERRSGGSTITEQLIKLAEPRPRTLRAKICEAVQAWRLEQIWSKDRILAAYLNRLDYGNLNVGCAQAARAYFGKPLADLSPAECALLAALPQSPTRLNPYRHPERAWHREAWVLGRMREEGFLPPDALARALAETPRLNPRARVFEAPHFAARLLAAQGRDALARAGGGTGLVRTTLDLELNRFITDRLRRHVASLRAEHVGNGAVVVIDNRRAEVLALVGSADFDSPRGGQIDGTWARRSPGSTIKPFTYELAFEHGATPADLIADLPAEFPARSAIYRPENYSHRYYGPMRLRPALANSLNISAVRVLADRAGGPAALQRRLRDAGLTTLGLPADHYGLGLTLGNAEARLLELTNAYAALARLGDYRPCQLLPTGTQPTPGTPLCDPRAAYLIADILSDNTARALSFGVDSNLRWDFPVACKTGTSTDFRDNWAVGYTPEFTIGVWVGNFDGRPMVNVSGVTGAGPLLHEVVERLHTRLPTTWYEPPPGVVARTIHRVTGHLLPPEKANGADAMTEHFLAEHLPAPESPSDYDAQGRVLLPADYAAWLDSGDNWLAGHAAAVAAPAGTPPADPGRGFAVLSPMPGTIYVLDPDLPPSSRLLDLRVRGTADPRWESPTLECRLVRGHPTAVLREGRHSLRVRDPASGEWRETWIEVRAL